MTGKFKNRNNEYSKQAEDFLRKTGTILSIVYVDTIPAREAWYNNSFSLSVDKYKVTIKRDHKMFTIYFFGSIDMCNKNLRPDAYDILSSLSCDYYEGTIDDFVKEFGYEVESWQDVKRIEKIYKAVCRETKSIKRLYNEDEIEMLLEIR